MVKLSYIRKENLNNLTLIFLIAWVFYHIITLGVSPLPSFDEVLFTNVSQNYSISGSLDLSIGILPNEKPEQILTYGPVYFYIHSFLIKIFGLNIIIGRLLSFLCGVLIFVLYIGYSKKTIHKDHLFFLLILLLGSDAKFNANMHSARMDLLAVMFYVLGVFFIYEKEKFLHSLFAGIFIALSFLTTPRIFIYFSGLLFLFIYDIYINKNNFKKYLIAGIVSSCLVFIWIYKVHGSLTDYINYFKNLGNYGEQNTSGMEKHLGINGLFFHLSNPSFLLFYLVSILLFVYKLFEKISIFLFILISFHVLFIQEQATYSAMILPFVYWFIAHGFLKLKNYTSITYFLKKSLFLLLFFNITTFSLKSVILFINWEGRNIKFVENKLLVYDLNNKSILSNYEYFYFVNQKLGKFTSIEAVNVKLNDTTLKNFQYAILDLATAPKFENRFGKHIKEKVILKNQGYGDSYLSNFISKKFNVYLSYDGCFYVLK